VTLTYFLISTDFEKVGVINTYDPILSEFTDAKDGGGSISRIIEKGDDFCYKYELKPTTQFPFAGVTISPKRELDISDFDYLECNWEVDTIKTIHVLIYFDFEQYEELFVLGEINAKPGRSQYQIPINSFDFPSWALKNRNISRTDLERLEITKINSIRFSNDIFQKVNQKDEICIKALQLGQYNHNQILIAIGLFVLGVFGHILVRKLKNVKIEISYKPAEVDSIQQKNIEQQETQEIINYINQNYTNSSLTLRSIRKAIKIPENKISLLIKKEFGISYKKYVNRLRIAEAKRLFRQAPDMRVNEVSDVVGFGGISTFNKVFKEETGMTPSEYTESIAK
jgi:AraC-like DNA-binding protein